MLFSEVFKEFYTFTHHNFTAQYLFFGLDGHFSLVPWIWTSIALNITGTLLFAFDPARGNPCYLMVAAISLFTGIWIEKGFGLIITLLFIRPWVRWLIIPPVLSRFSLLRSAGNRGVCDDHASQAGPGHYFKVQGRSISIRSNWFLDILIDFYCQIGQFHNNVSEILTLKIPRDTIINSEPKDLRSCQEYGLRPIGCCWKQPCLPCLERSINDRTSYKQQISRIKYLSGR